MAPVADVDTEKSAMVELAFVYVLTPSVKVYALGVTDTFVKLSPNAIETVNEPVTLSVVV